MSMAMLERAVLAGARIAFNNPTLRQKDIMEWGTSGDLVKKNLADDEVAVYVPDPGVWVAVGKTYDKRK